MGQFLQSHFSFSFLFLPTSWFQILWNRDFYYDDDDNADNDNAIDNHNKDNHYEDNHKKTVKTKKTMFF